MMETTVIRKACWVVAWDEEAAAHHYLRHVDVAFAGNEIIHVGAGYGGEAAVEIDGAGTAGCMWSSPNRRPKALCSSTDIA